MNRQFARCLADLAIIVACAASAFSQGLYWESKNTMGANGEVVNTSKMYAMPKMLKTVNDSNGNEVIFRIDKDLMYVVHPTEKTYEVVTFAEVEASMKTRNEELHKRMQAMPEAQRKMMEKMMGGGEEKPVDIKATGETRVIGGHSCMKYVATQDGKEMMTLWTTRDIKDFERMKKDWVEVSKRMLMMSPGGAKGIAEAFSKIEGFPMETQFSGMSSMVTKIEKRSTPVSEFEVPTGYTKVKSALQEANEKAKKSGK
jgi:hypothetical protein